MLVSGSVPRGFNTQAKERLQVACGGRGRQHQQAIHHGAHLPHRLQLHLARDPMLLDVWELRAFHVFFMFFLSLFFIHVCLSLSLWRCLLGGRPFWESQGEIQIKPTISVVPPCVTHTRAPYIYIYVCIIYITHRHTYTHTYIYIYIHIIDSKQV